MLETHHLADDGYGTLVICERECRWDYACGTETHKNHDTGWSDKQSEKYLRAIPLAGFRLGPLCCARVFYEVL